MPLFKKTDTANSVPLLISLLNKMKPNTINRTAMFNNVTPGQFGVFVVDKNEAQANPQFAHAGIILRKQGTGRRAGRIQTEVLVAGGTHGPADADAAVVADASVKFLATRPADVTVSAPAAASLVTNPTIKPANATVTYQWQVSVSNGAFTNVTNVGVYTGALTNTLAISNSTGLNGNRYQVIATPLNGVAKTSRIATLTVL